MDKLKGFWKKNKNTIKNITILVVVPVAVLALTGVNRLNKIIKENDLEILFYGNEDE